MSNGIEKDSPLSLYYQLKELLIKKIENGEYAENEKLPTEKELCEKHNISRATVRQALKELENEDYIYKVQGKGTFVSPSKFQQDLLKFYSFTEDMKKIGKKPSSKVLDFKIKKVDEKMVRKMLDVSSSEKIYVFTRLRLADDEPMMVETTYIPYERFKNISEKDLREKPLYDIMVNEYGVIFSKAEETFRPTLIREKEAEQLNFVEGGPGMLLERITYDNENRIIEYTKSVARGDKFKYHVELEN
ncbi:MAG: GntR family transcriptional regulator [Bacillota bacterium]